MSKENKKLWENYFKQNTEQMDKAVSNKTEESEEYYKKKNIEMSNTISILNQADCLATQTSK